MNGTGKGTKKKGTSNKPNYLSTLHSSIPVFIFRHFFNPPQSVWKRVKLNLFPLLLWLCNILAPVHFHHNVGVVQGGDCYLTTVVFRQVRGRGGCRVGGNNHPACGGRRRAEGHYHSDGPTWQPGASVPGPAVHLHSAGATHGLWNTEQDLTENMDAVIYQH